MAFPDLLSPAALDNIGREMHRLISDLYPLCRSITGDGVRETIRAMRRHIPLEACEIPSGTEVFDWTVPREWNIRDAYIKNPRGERIVDFQKSNLHVLSYSLPVQGKMSLKELVPHLFTLPEHPDWIPYRTSYYKENWGFCLSHRQFLNLADETYEVCIDSTMKDGHLTYGEYYLPGETAAEVLVSCHICHPSLGNDNLSGIALVTFLAQSLTSVPRRYSYRFLFLPGAIGAITWLALNESRVAKIQNGLVVAGVGDAGPLTYKKSRRGDAAIDRAFSHVLKHSGGRGAVIDFDPGGYNERQFCSPGFNLPVGCLMRTPHGRYPEYHTSADNLDFVQPSSLAESLARSLAVMHILEGDRTYLNQNPKCEPRLGKRNLYGGTGGSPDRKIDERAFLWVLNLSDGGHSLLQIAERSGLEFGVVQKAADLLRRSGLLEETRTV